MARSSLGNTLHPEECKTLVVKGQIVTKISTRGVLQERFINCDINSPILFVRHAGTGGKISKRIRLLPPARLLFGCAGCNSCPHYREAVCKQLAAKAREPPGTFGPATLRVEDLKTRVLCLQYGPEDWLLLLFDSNLLQNPDDTFEKWSVGLQHILQHWAVVDSRRRAAALQRDSPTKQLHALRGHAAASRPARSPSSTASEAESSPTPAAERSTASGRSARSLPASQRMEDTPFGAPGIHPTYDSLTTSDTGTRDEGGARDLQWGLEDLESEDVTLLPSGAAIGDCFVMGGPRGNDMEGAVGSQALAKVMGDHADFIDYRAVAIGQRHCIAVSKGGLIYAWGSGDRGELGSSAGFFEEGGMDHPAKVPYLEQVRISSAACSGSYSAAVTADGSLWVWGDNSSGQLGLGEYTAPQMNPKRLDSLDSFSIRQVACGPNHCAAVSQSGELFTWGDAAYGRLGHIEQQTYLRPRLVDALKRHHAVQVSCGWYHTAALVQPRGCSFGQSGSIATSSGGGSSLGAATGSGSDDGAVATPSQVAVGASMLFTWGGVFSLEAAHPEGAAAPLLLPTAGAGATAGEATASVNGQHAVSRFDQEVQPDADAPSGSIEARPPAGGTKPGKAAAAPLKAASNKGCLGLGKHFKRHGTPVPEMVEGPLKDSCLKQVSCGENLTCVLNSQGEVYQMGAAAGLAALAGSKQPCPWEEAEVPTRVLGPLADVFVDDLCCGRSHVIAIASPLGAKGPVPGKRRTQLYVWGQNEEKQLGLLEKRMYRGADGRLQETMVPAAPRGLPTKLSHPALVNKEVFYAAAGYSMTALVVKHDVDLSTSSQSAFKRSATSRIAGGRPVGVRSWTNLSVQTDLDASWSGAMAPASDSSRGVRSQAISGDLFTASGRGNRPPAGLKKGTSTNSRSGRPPIALNGLPNSAPLGTGPASFSAGATRPASGAGLGSSRGMRARVFRANLGFSDGSSTKVSGKADRRKRVEEALLYGQQSARAGKETGALATGARARGSMDLGDERRRQSWARSYSQSCFQDPPLWTSVGALDVAGARQVSHSCHGDGSASARRESLLESAGPPELARSWSGGEAGSDREGSLHFGLNGPVNGDVKDEKIRELRERLRVQSKLLDFAAGNGARAVTRPCTSLPHSPRRPLENGHVSGTGLDSKGAALLGASGGDSEGAAAAGNDAQGLETASSMPLELSTLGRSLSLRASVIVDAPLQKQDGKDAEGEAQGTGEPDAAQQLPAAGKGFVKHEKRPSGDMSNFSFSDAQQVKRQRTISPSGLMLLEQELAERAAALDLRWQELAELEARLLQRERSLLQGGGAEDAGASADEAAPEADDSGSSLRPPAAIWDGFQPLAAASRPQAAVVASDEGETDADADAGAGAGAAGGGETTAAATAQSSGRAGAGGEDVPGLVSGGGEWDDSNDSVEENPLFEAESGDSSWLGRSSVLGDPGADATSGGEGAAERYATLAAAAAAASALERKLQEARLEHQAARQALEESVAELRGQLQLAQVQLQSATTMQQELSQRNADLTQQNAALQQQLQEASAAAAAAAATAAAAAMPAADPPSDAGASTATVAVAAAAAAAGAAALAGAPVAAAGAERDGPAAERCSREKVSAEAAVEEPAGPAPAQPAGPAPAQPAGDEARPASGSWDAAAATAGTAARQGRPAARPLSASMPGPFAPSSQMQGQRGRYQHWGEGVYLYVEDPPVPGDKPLLRRLRFAVRRFCTQTAQQWFAANRDALAEKYQILLPPPVMAGTGGDTSQRPAPTMQQLLQSNAAARRSSAAGVAGGSSGAADAAEPGAPLAHSGAADALPSMATTSLSTPVSPRIGVPAAALPAGALTEAMHNPGGSERHDIGPGPEAAAPAAEVDSRSSGSRVDGLAASTGQGGSGWHQALSCSL